MRANSEYRYGRNSEGYLDPTATKALENIRRGERQKASKDVGAGVAASFSVMFMEMNDFLNMNIVEALKLYNALQKTHEYRIWAGGSSYIITKSTYEIGLGQEVCFELVSACGTGNKTARTMRVKFG